MNRKMDLNEIEQNRHHPDFQYRLKAMAALQDHPSEVAVPILKQHLEDPEFLVRTFVARALGQHLNPDAYAALLQIVKLDNTPNVRAEAANSLSLFGPISAAHLVEIFCTDDHWLVRRSILPALVELQCYSEVLETTNQGLQSDDAAVQEASIDALAALADSPQAGDALAQLLKLKNNPLEYIRVRVAYALHRFSGSDTTDALEELRQDTDYRVVRAAMEGLI